MRMTIDQQIEIARIWNNDNADSNSAFAVFEKNNIMYVEKATIKYPQTKHEYIERNIELSIGLKMLNRKGFVYPMEDNKLKRTLDVLTRNGE